MSHTEPLHILKRLVADLARAVQAVDGRAPVALNQRTGVAFGAGLGPHSETETFRLIVAEAQARDPQWYTRTAFNVPYPAGPRQRCDVVFATPEGELFVEGKLLRLLGDNGKPNDHMLMHILSPYPEHRSALTDCIKLAASGFEGVKAIAIVGYDYPSLPMEPAIQAFEMLAANVVQLGTRSWSKFSDLVHPIHRTGLVVAWAVEEVRPAIE